jgi:CBS domain-containing protein
MQEPIRNVLALKGREVAKVAQSEMVLAAVEQMNRRHIGSVIVVAELHPGARPVGIFSERDVLTRVIARGLMPSRTPVGEVMTREVCTISCDTTVMDAMMVMTDRRCRHLPVVDGDQVVGMVSIGDLTSWLVRDQQRTIEELHDYMHRA